MKRYDGRTKPIPKQRPTTGKGKKAKKLVSNKFTPIQNLNHVCFLLQNPKIPPASAPHPAPAEYMCLMRAVYKNEKISTIVHAKDVNKFQLAYCNLLKSNMDGLKRQKKVKTKKAMQ